LIAAIAKAVITPKMPSDMITIDLPVFGPAYDALYAVLSHLFRQIVDESYFTRWQKTEAQNFELKTENMRLKAELAKAEPPSPRRNRVEFCIERPTLLPLWQGADSPV
jgi:hypothetical protein